GARGRRAGRRMNGPGASPARASGAGSARASGASSAPASGAKRRTLVKVCGLTRAEDAKWARECGADWLGFIVHAEGPRRIEPERAAAIVDELGGNAADAPWQPVAVMV